MSFYYKEKELRAVEGKLKTTIKGSGFLLKNFWKVLVFGIAFSFFAPTYVSGNYLSGYRTAVGMNIYSYQGLVIFSALLYTFFCFLGHFVWKYQDQKKIKRLEMRKRQLEEELGIVKASTEI